MKYGIFFIVSIMFNDLFILSLTTFLFHSLKQLLSLQQICVIISLVMNDILQFVGYLELYSHEIKTNSVCFLRILTKENWMSTTARLPIFVVFLTIFI